MITIALLMALPTFVSAQQQDALTVTVKGVSFKMILVQGGTKSAGYKYSGSNDINAVAWYKVNAYDKGVSSLDYGTHVVKTKKPNELGIYDMSGNMYEWCSDWYGDYTDAAQTNPKGASSGSDRVARGGGWGYSAGNCRSSNRSYASPDSSHFGFGLRLVLLP